METEKEALKRLYIDMENSTREIANIYHCSPVSILRKMKKYEIERRSHSEVYKLRQKKSEKKYSFDKEKLEELYYEKELSKKDISRLLKVPYKVIEYWTNKYEIRKTIQITKNELKDSYLKKKMSMAKIASIYKVTSGTIFNALKKHNLKRRTLREAAKLRPARLSQRKIKIGKEDLNELYWEKKLSSNEIGNILNCNYTTVLKWMNIWGIKRRSYKESATPISLEKQKKMQQCLHIKPTKPERLFIEIVEKNKLPYRYTGNGDVMIGKKNPDFFNTNGNKAVIEIFGEVYHSPLFSFIDNIGYNRSFKGTIEHYKNYGLKCIIFWDRDILREDAEQFVIKTLYSEGAL